MSWTDTAQAAAAASRRWLNVVYCTAKVHLRWLGRSVMTERPTAANVVVTLTSYPKRFSTLSLTLRCLLTQSVAPRHVVLWIAGPDYAALPDDVLALRTSGLDIRQCADLRSYKKLIPAIEAFPQDVLVTADDDVYYAANWLQLLLETWDGSNSLVTCHRAREFMTDSTGTSVSPYDTWPLATENTPATAIFPTGVGGVLYPPGSLSAEVLNAEAFTALCPLGDDIWFYWMARRAGSRYRCVIGQWSEIDWPAAQTSALHHENVGSGRNDQQIGAMVRVYGMPG